MVTGWHEVYASQYNRLVVLVTAVVGSRLWGALSEPLEDFERIEVIRGQGSALYGANACR